MTQEASPWLHGVSKSSDNNSRKNTQLNPAAKRFVAFYRRQMASPDTRSSVQNSANIKFR